jgi:hypothetical protein
MRFLLSQQLAGSVIHIALGPERAYHVIWGGESIASAATLAGAIARASAGPLVRPNGSMPPSLLHPSADPARWVVWSSTETAARSSGEASLRKDPPRSLRAPSPAIRKVARVGSKSGAAPLVAS